jgi:hypothetical protein
MIQKWNFLNLIQKKRSTQEKKRILPKFIFKCDNGISTKVYLLPEFKKTDYFLKRKHRRL